MNNLKIFIRPRRILKNLIIIFLTAILFVGISGCGTQNNINTNEEARDTDTQITTTTETTTNTSGSNDLIYSCIDESTWRVYPTPTAEEIAAVDTSNWNIYESKEYGFSIKYPYDWLLLDIPDSNTVNFYSKDDVTVEEIEKVKSGEWDFSSFYNMAIVSILCEKSKSKIEGKETFSDKEKLYINNIPVEKYYNIVGQQDESFFISLSDMIRLEDKQNDIDYLIIFKHHTFSQDVYGLIPTFFNEGFYAMLYSLKFID